MSPAGRVHHLRPTDATLVGDVIIGLQNSVQLTQKPRPAFPAAAHATAAHRRPADVHAGLAQQNRALAVERTVISVFAHDGVDDDLIGNKTLVDDSYRQRSGLHALFFTLLLLASPLLALGHFHVILGRLHLENFALFVADHHGLFSAVAAHALLRRAGNDLFHPRKIGRQRLPARML